MTNVLIDENGLSKAPVYDHTAPLLHRSAVTAGEGSDPAGSASIDTFGYEEARFDIDIGRAGFTSLEVPVLFWSSRLSQWIGVGKRLFTGTGPHDPALYPLTPKRLVSPWEAYDNGAMRHRIAAAVIVYTLSIVLACTSSTDDAALFSSAIDQSPIPTSADTQVELDAPLTGVTGVDDLSALSPKYGDVLVLANRGDPPSGFDTMRTSSIALHHVAGGPHPAQVYTNSAS